ncbi:hypothetical protein [Bradyrhizobium diazoefficiens]|uniref:hypothetical protein n=1 Tax=Bradyrhizobium diazoefficiens TaxID=1355477 RepID=UPI0004B361E2|nr:hypothetical protein [Bradyrhizobium diazoefficiens]
MDDYPKKFEPARDQFGGIDLDRFPEWWKKASKFYRGVPEECARYWLFEHWGVSPYSSLKSREYIIERQTWPAAKILEVVSSWCRFDPEHNACREKGEELCKKRMLNGDRYPTATYMLEEGEFPTPIVVLDNLDAHMSEDRVGRRDGLPVSLVLIEGHRRFNIALYLLTQDKLKPNVDVWLMTKIQA